MIVFAPTHWNLASIYQQVQLMGVELGQDYRWSFCHPRGSWAVEFTDVNIEMFYAVKLAFWAEGITWIKNAG